MNSYVLLQLILWNRPCRAEQQTMLDNTETRSILDRAKDASSSLLWLRDSDSFTERGSICSEGSSKLSLRFSFDQEIIGSRAYRTLFVSFIKQRVRHVWSSKTKQPETDMIEREALLNQESSLSPILVDSNLGENSRISESTPNQSAEKQRVSVNAASSQLPPFWRLSSHSDPVSLQLVPTDTERGSQTVQLYRAIRSMDLCLVVELVKCGADIHAKLDKNWTLWHFAARASSCGPLIELLLENGANIDALDPQGRTVLYDACYHRRTSLVKLLLARGADPEAHQDSSGNSPLHAAVERESVGAHNMSDIALIICMLLDAGVPIDCRNKTGSTALDQIYLNIKTREFLLLSELRRSGILYSTLNSDTSIAPQDQASFNSWLRNMYESYVGLMNVVQLLLDRGARPSAWYSPDFWGSRIEAIRQLGTIDGDAERISRMICDWAVATLKPSETRALEQ